ncbi:MAG: GntR family transcriptional regulator [Bacillota bacterium]
MTDKPQSLKSRIHSSILEGIITDEYKPGQIISEKQLVEKYSISKSPVREALIELCNEGVLRNLPRYGYEVVRLTRSDVEDILNFRLILEGCCLSKCYLDITEEQLKILEELNRHCNTPDDSEDLWSHWRHNQHFHLKLLSFYNNQYAYEQLKKSLDILTRAYAQFYWDKWTPSHITIDIKYHSKIIENIRNKNIDEALRYLSLDMADFGI